MRSTNKKILGAVAVAGVVAATGSAFTATSTIDDPEQFVGAVSQSITGVTVSSVNYTVDASDKTTGVAFRVAQDLTAQDVVTATISNGTATEEKACAAKDEGATPVAGTDYTCSFTGVTNVTSLKIVVS